MAKECNSTSCTKESCEGCPSKAKPDFHVDLNKDSSIAHVIGVVSGKGGVGKSMVTASLANQMAKAGYRVGILDADITGPSIPKMYGLKGPAQVWIRNRSSKPNKPAPNPTAVATMMPTGRVTNRLFPITAIPMTITVGIIISSPAGFW